MDENTVQAVRRDILQRLDSKADCTTVTHCAVKTRHEGKSRTQLCSLHHRGSNNSRTLCNKCVNAVPFRLSSAFNRLHTSKPANYDA